MAIDFKSFNSVPQGGDIVDSWAISYKAILIRKEFGDYEVQETERPITFKGMIQNNQGSRMDIKDIGIRRWKSYSLWDTYYNYYRYDLTEDYTDNGTGT